MTNAQARLIGSSGAMIAGAIACASTSLDVNVGIVILVIGSALFVAEYSRAQKP